MPSAKASNSVLRNLPSVDELLRSNTARSVAISSGERHAAGLVRRAIDELRTEVSDMGTGAHSKQELLARGEKRITELWGAERVAGVQRVLNATGVIIHTNLGRAPLSEEARNAIAGAAGYCALEYDLATGKRGRRGARAEEMLAELTGAESVVIVNNCAAAAFFVLSVFAAGGEVVISRGELVEIGGDFRVPDVLSQSGATLREVGTTNRTKLVDYEKAINKNTRLLLSVHPSNYRIVGFTAKPSVAELAALAQRHGLVFYEDIGSGALTDLGSVGLSDEPIVTASVSAGVDIVTFSGDKLLGGPQAGIIAGKTEFIERLRNHPLYRALRVDKLAYAGLEATLEAYRRGDDHTEVPVQKMLSLSKGEIEARAKRFIEKLNNELGIGNKLKCEPRDGESAVGGGAAPTAHLVTTLIAVTHETLAAPSLELALRHSSPPVITRIVADEVLIDLRTILEDEETELLSALARIA